MNDTIHKITEILQIKERPFINDMGTLLHTQFQCIKLTNKQYIQSYT
jgi:hypothetical protein